MFQKFTYCFRRFWRIRDRRLPIQIRGNNQAAFRELINSLHDQLYSFVLYHFKSPYLAKSIVEEALRKVWQERKSLDPDTELVDHAINIAIELVYKKIHQTANSYESRVGLRHTIRLATGIVRKAGILKRSKDLVDKAIPDLLLKKLLTFKLATIT